MPPADGATVDEDVVAEEVAMRALMAQRLEEGDGGGGQAAAAGGGKDKDAENGGGGGDGGGGSGRHALEVYGLRKVFRCGLRRKVLWCAVEYMHARC